MGIYQLPVTGTYFIEIIGLLCNDVGFLDDFQNTCLEQPATHRLTHDEAAIHVARITPLSSLSTTSHRRHLDSNHTEINPFGYWKWPSSLSSSASSIVDEQQQPPHSLPEPLFTRYQPPNFRMPQDVATNRCAQPGNLSRHDGYEFQWNTNVNMTHELLQNNNHINHTKICVVGASHAQELAKQMQSWIVDLDLARGVSVRHVYVQYPQGINKSFIFKAILMGRNHCHKSVIGLGQWSAGWPGGAPTKFPEYYAQMETLIQLLQQTRVDFVLRSVHYNPLGNIISSCPPKDWRSPPVIDKYNEILRHSCRKHGVPFIDTNFILAPMWDSSPDWCHFRGVPSRTEGLYILRTMLVS